MPKYAVAYYLDVAPGVELEIVEASNWKEALGKVLKIDINTLWDDLEKAKRDADYDFDVKEIT